MEMWLADPAFFHGYGQGTRQLVELLSAFGLTAPIGLEREIQGKAPALARRRSWGHPQHSS